DRGGSGVTIDRLVPVENADAPELLDHGQTEHDSVERVNAVRELLPPPRCLFVAEIGNDELAETPEQMEVGRAQVRNDLPQNGEILLLEGPLSWRDLGMDGYQRANLAQGLVQVHRLDADDLRTGFRCLEKGAYAFFELVEDMVQQVVDPDHVEEALWQAGRSQWSADELRAVRHTVEQGPLLGEIDRTRRNVQAGDAGTEPGEDHRVLALAAADVEDRLVVQIAQHPEAIFFRIEHAGPAISVEHGRFDRFQKPPVVLRPAIEELGLLRALGWNLAFGLLPRDVALHAHPFQAARTRPPSSGRLFTEQALCPPLGTNEPPHELFTATRPAGCRKPERTWGTTFLLWEPLAYLRSTPWSAPCPQAPCECHGEQRYGEPGK